MQFKIQQSKVDSALRIIERCLKVSGSPVIAWSGGKDSMAMLHLIHKQAGARLPVIFFREQWQPRKYAFQNRIIEEWELEVHSWQPSKTSFQQNGDEFEVQNTYLFDYMTMTCPTGITPMEDGQPWACALDIYQRPQGNGIRAGWDALFIGHKRCDSDPIYGGDAGTRVQVRVNPGQVDNWYPLHDWTHDDVFQYCEDYGVPIQTDRYEKFVNKWSERADKSANCDYVHACTRCVDRRPDAPRFVECPKLGFTIENVSARVAWADHSLPTYMKD